MAQVSAGIPTTMSTPLFDNARIYKVLEHSPWPHNLRDITSHLECAFAPISNEIIDRLSPFSKELYESEVRNSSHPISLQECHQIASPRPITDFLDTLLATVRNLRDFAQANTGNLPPRPTFPILMPLLLALALGCSQDADILTDIPFLLPRMSEVQELREGDIFEGRASLLVSAYIPPKQTPSLEAESMEVDDDNEVSMSSPSGSSSTIANQISFVPFEGPADGHILPGYGQRIDCVLPVVCIADEDNILSLVSSIVYQRHCWGISLPAVGIFIDRMGTIATIVIGWIDEIEAEHCPQNRLPPVNLAFSSSPGTAGPSTGVYDLLDPLSALQFGHFIIGLSKHFPIIERCISDSHIRDLCWRLDHVQLMKAQDLHSESAHLDLSARVLAWLGNINCAKALSPAQPTFNSPMSQKRSTAASSKRGVPKLNSGSLTVPSAASSNQESNPSRRSASSFARLKNENGTDRWLWERETLRIGRIKIEEKYEINAQINAMIKEYDDHFTLAWPTEWKNIDDVSCDPICRDTLNLLFLQYKEYRGINMGDAKLDGNQYLFLKNRVSILLSSIIMSRSRVYQSVEGVAVNEAERRAAIDSLMHFFWCSQDKNISDTYFAESSIHLPVNKAVSGILKKEPMSALWRHLSITQMDSTLAQSAYSGKWDIAAQSMAERFKLMQNMWGETYTTAIPKENRKTEPSQTKCDGFAGTRISVAVGCESSAIQTASETMGQPNASNINNNPQIPDIKSRLPVPSFIFGHQWSIWSGFKFVLPKAETSSACPGTPTPVAATRDPTNDNKPAEDHTLCIHCPAVTSSLQTPSSIHPRSHPYMVATELFCPLLFCEYKRSDYDDVHTAFHQCQMDCVSGIESLRALGITDFPIYGMVMTGSRASIMMGWHSMKEINQLDPNREAAIRGCNILMDQYLVSFDLREPLDAYRFAISIHRIYLAQHKRLKEILTPERIGIWHSPQQG
ncbi:hypothetical protein HYPSUDRAFT_215946 [Hypholoma sublateritium FD-334 SS-4]|uniref:Uncharacterized protein n=1 Tax=Hypholoma sublateritium (strain FD-334 SS-4) TaxID=945553 RepID=A0A0D2P0A6_HYPSF|nr:hypothetical protein HYPSUDRAFT_215946 [Hypholoma sublateritium FD-334 SS-4]